MRWGGPAGTMRGMTKATKTRTAAKKPAAPAPVPEAAPEPASGSKLGKAQLALQVAERAGLSRKEADVAVEAFVGTVVETLRAGQSVGLPGLGTLSVRETQAREGVRPGTSERIQIPAGRKVAFKVASSLKSSL